jgi:hypothetical protein
LLQELGEDFFNGASCLEGECGTSISRNVATGDFEAGPSWQETGGGPTLTADTGAGSV